MAINSGKKNDKNKNETVQAAAVEPVIQEQEPYNIMDDDVHVPLNVDGKNYIFFSYARADKDMLREFGNKIHSKAYVWFDMQGIESGEYFDRVISNRIVGAKVFIAFLSPRFEASEYCNKEYKLAGRRGIPIIPFVLEEFEWSAELDLKLGDLEQINPEQPTWLKKLTDTEVVKSCLREVPILSPEEKKKKEADEQKERERRAEEQRIQAREERIAKRREKREAKKKEKQEANEQKKQQSEKKPQKGARGKQTKKTFFMVSRPVGLVLLAVVALVLVFLLSDALRGTSVNMVATTGEAETSDAVSTEPDGDPFSSSGLEDHVMEWGDENLEAAMRELTGIAEGDIMLSDVWSYTELDLTDSGTKDISALAELTQIKKLVVADYDSDSEFTPVDVTGLEALSSLPALWVLHLDGQMLDNDDLRQLVDILEPLPELRYLGIDFNMFDDVSPLAKLKQLTTLVISSNTIQDLSPLSEMTSLTQLVMRNAGLSDLSFLSEMNDMIWLALGGNEITDITPLAGMTGMKKLYLSDNKIEDLTPLAGMSDMEELNLSNNQIEVIAPLAGMTKITGIYLSDNKIEDISSLANMTTLERLYIGGNRIHDLSALSGLTSLRKLTLGENQITDITPLENLVYLTELALNKNSVADITPLAKMHGMRMLWLQNNYITDVTPLTSLTALQYLDVRENKIEDLSAIEAMGIEKFFH